jgi:hypothetical protein
MPITSSRLHRVIGVPERQNAWEAFERRTAIETVSRDPRPVRAVVGVIMTAIATGGSMMLGWSLATEIARMFNEIAQAFSAAF